MPRSRVTASQRRAITARAKGCCEYCRSQAIYGLQSFSAEHIIPLDKGGPTTLDNLALSYQGCNGHKYNKIEGYDPVTQTMTGLYHPRQQGWSEHFAWSSDGSLVVGLTPTGRATVEELKLNRPSVINLRRVLFTLNLHPPAE